MAKITFSTAEKELLVRKLQGYFSKELDVELGQFDTEFLIDFIGEEMGAYFYNRGVQDAQVVIASKLSDMSDALDEITLTTAFVR
jgi:uncharacterized protein (DUF2164 family)